ncbi:hypothetical protein P692DRAFT_201726163 [Suillus brevipes Sb2]|nr:hypothetical protein P692DRAFT_201726163 [Suillus brevipes Sb2]
MNPAGHSIVCQCTCGRSFAQLNAYANHQRTCKKRKKHLSNALAKAKELWTTRKRPCREDKRDELSVFTPLTIAHNAETRTSRAGESASSHAVEDPRSLAERRPRRINRRLPARFRDILPQPPPMTEPAPSPAAGPPPAMETSALSSRTLRFFHTLPNVFGLSRRYYSHRLPTHDPEELTTLDNLTLTHSESDQDFSMPARVIHSGNIKAPDAFYPYPNKSSFLLGDWFWNGGIQKSQKSFKELLRIIADTEFRPEDIRATRWNLINNRLGSSADDAEAHDNVSFEGAGWKKTAICIKVPIHKRAENPGVHDYLTTDLHHRPLVSVIQEKLANEKHDELFHYQPYELLWNRGASDRPIRVHGELYNSEAFIQAHREVQESPAEPGCDLERVVVALMFWSDSTHLNSFGNSKLWPCYMFFGNESKYRRCKPSCRLCSHVAYFNHLPDSFKDFATKHFGGKGPSADFIAHCHRELYHAQWKILLDDEFIEACKHGIVICCCDGIERRFYPRIFTYSADYPEKALIATIRNLGGCPCPRCLIPKFRVQNLGMSLDIKQRETLARIDNNARQSKVVISRSHIYDLGYGIRSTAVENLLKEHSLVPTTNAFSEKLGCLGFNLFIMLVVDLMHEFELGVWKALFVHLIRILSSACAGDELVHELDRRYRLTPAFGRDTIRTFASNASEMRKMAARDFEDLLQCAIPVFDALLPEPHNTYVLTLLGTCARWHALAKLRMHTDETIDLLDTNTVALGKQLRHFQKHTCMAFKTQELKREAERRQRQQLRHGAGNGEATTSTHQSSRRPKTFNLQTYKLHALGDYSTSIRRFGTTDSYSTEPGELEHRTSKARYHRTDRKEFVKQITSIERREARIHRIRDKQSPHNMVIDEDVATSPEARFHVGKSQNYPENIPLFIQRHLCDPAVKDFLPKLQQFLLAQIKVILTKENGPSHTNSSTASTVPGVSPPCSDSEVRVFIKADRMYRHNLMRLNYTTYDVRRAQDIINPSTSHCNVMLLGQANGDSTDGGQHPYLYARVLGIYHVNVTYIGPGMINYSSQRIDFLWVRWYQHVDVDEGSSWRTPLDRVYFPPMAEPDTFGFVDPNDVLRCCHVIPQFAQGLRRSDGSGVSNCAQDKLDWRFYFINRFVDRDMFMRYQWGLGIGHTYTHASHKYTDTTADFEDLEREEVDFDQDQDMHHSDGEASDSDLGSDSDEDCDEEYSDNEFTLDYEN